MSTTFCAIENLTPAQIGQLLEIYEEAFPPEERDPPAALLQGIGMSDRTALVACDGAEVLGFAFLSRLTPECGFLEYLAVDHRRRNAGIGAAILQQLRARFAGEYRGLVFEAEHVAAGVDEADRALRARRIAFYERNSAEVIDCAPNYRAPSFSGEAPLHYALLWLPLQPNTSIPRGDELVACVRAILVESYGLDETDTLVEQAVAALRC